MKSGNGVSKTNEVTLPRNSQFVTILSQFVTRNSPLLICFCLFLTVSFLSAALGEDAINSESEIQNSELESANSESSVSKDGATDSDSIKNGFQEWNNNAVPIMSRLFVWIGFIMSIGLTAKILTAFNDRHIGLMTVIFVGCVGALASMILLPMVYVGCGFKPVSPLGFGVAVLIAFLILLFYSKILRLFGEEEQK
ncbi:MAG: hypothetical protein IKW80_01860 [Thermoguttaceae bacterium]|nr:hypothetical protein [Thermoguttaceae bacterium]